MIKEKFIFKIKNQKYILYVKMENEIFPNLKIISQSKILMKLFPNILKFNILCFKKN